MKKHTHHKPNWFWVENFHGGQMNELTFSDFNTVSTFYEQWASLHFSKNPINGTEQTIKLNIPITYQTILDTFQHQGSDCLALFVSKFNIGLYKELEAKKVQGKVYIKSCKYYELGNTTEFDVTYIIG